MADDVSSTQEIAQSLMATASRAGVPTLEKAVAARMASDYPAALRMLAGLPQDDPDANHERALAWHLSGEPERAVPYYDHALARDGANARLAFNYGSALGDLGQLCPALEKFELAARLDPSWDAPIAAMASVQERRHDLDGALVTLAPLVARATTDVNARLTYARVLRRMHRCADALRILSRGEWPDQDGLAARARATVEFERARSLDMAGHYAAAAATLRSANALCPSTYRPDRARAYADAIRAGFGPGISYPAPLDTAADAWRPVFIVGMPRSGTSLVNQCLSAHSGLNAIGESPLLDAVFRKALELAGNDPKAIPRLAVPVLQALRAAYEEPCRNQAAANKAQLTIDKMPGNILYLGLVALLWPEAVVIHCDRDRRDVALSCYFQDFAAGHEYSQSFAGIANHIEIFASLRSHWQDTLPLAMWSVGYEAFVTDPRQELAALLQRLGLDWEEGCLTAHRAPPTSYTASYAEIAAPIHALSVGRWKTYARHLPELAAL